VTTKPKVEPEPVVAYETWTAEELRDELHDRKLPTGGNKPDLVARLQESDAAPPESAAPMVDGDVPVKTVGKSTSRQPAEDFCVVDDGTGHYADGRAIPGTKVCSAHEMHYFRDGTRRGA
jgi:hypothetical protein